MLGLSLSHEIPVQELVPGDIDQFLSGIAQVEFGADERQDQQKQQQWEHQERQDRQDRQDMVVNNKRIKS